MALGILPHDLGQLRLVVEARAVAQTTLRVLQDHGVASPELVEDIADALTPTANGRGAR